MCRRNFDFNISCRTEYHTMTQYCKDNGTIALAKEPKISPEVQTHKAVVYATTSYRGAKSRLRRQRDRPAD